jgi:hypothetical protein
MTNAQWEPDDAPDWFWELIEKSHGDRERFRELASELSLQQLRAAYDNYMDLASFVTRSDIDEDRATDLANWIVAQGKAYYFDVYEEMKPSPDEVPNTNGAGFLSALIKVFMDRYGVHFVDPNSPR